MQARQRKLINECSRLIVADYELGPRFIEAMNKSKLLDPAYRES